MIRILEDEWELNYLDTLENFVFPLTIYLFIFILLMFSFFWFISLSLHYKWFMERSLGEIQYPSVVDILYSFNSFNL